MDRVALKDDVVPLAHPITTPFGQILTSLKIKAGQVCRIFTLIIFLTPASSTNALIVYPDTQHLHQPCRRRMERRPRLPSGAVDRTWGSSASCRDAGWLE